jgi:hypothetical protein
LVSRSTLIFLLTFYFAVHCRVCIYGSESSSICHHGGLWKYYNKSWALVLRGYLASFNLCTGLKSGQEFITFNSHCCINSNTHLVVRALLTLWQGAPEEERAWTWSIRQWLESGVNGIITKESDVVWKHIWLPQELRFACAYDASQDSTEERNIWEKMVFKTQISHTEASHTLEAYVSTWFIQFEAKPDKHQVQSYYNPIMSQSQNPLCG